jgi:hypothetical protein
MLLQGVLHRTAVVDGARHHWECRTVRSEDGPQKRRAKRFAAAGETVVGALAAGETAVGALAAGETGAGALAAGETAVGALAAGETGAGALAAGEAGAGALAPTAMAGTGAPTELVLIADPETRRRVAMAAESDLEASRYAHWRGTVTFHDVAGAWFNMSDPNLSDELRAQFKTIFPGLLDAFAEPRKGIITAYFCRHIRVAAALTDIGHAADAPEGVPEAALKGPPPASLRPLLEQSSEPKMKPQARRKRPWYRRVFNAHVFDPAPASSSAIHIEPTFGDPADWKAKELIFHCLHLHYKALEFLAPQPRKICMRMIFGVITTLLGTLDQRQLDHVSGRPGAAFGSDPTEVEALERELAQAQAYYRQAAQRQAQLDYLLGMLTFLAIAAVVTAIVALTAGLLDQPATVAVLGGATGATVSVMSRMSSGGLKLNPESGTKTIRALGFMRPIIGAVFGAVVFAFLDGGIIDLFTPPRDETQLAFYAGLGFVSGFSERFAQDVIAQVGPKAPQPPDTARSPAPP